MNLDRFVGLPWRDNGRDASGLDCWGLVRLVLAERGIVLPSHTDDYQGTADRPALAGLFAAGRQAWREIAAGQERPLDLVLIRQRPWHVGLVLEAGQMLHIPHEGTSRVERYTAPAISRRIDGFFRHEALA